jgi:hypothetical protein
MTNYMHEFPHSKNPRVLDSGFWLDTQTDINQGLNADSRIQRILGWILRILPITPVFMQVCGLFPESSCSPYYYVVGNPMGFPTLRRAVLSLGRV